MQQVLRERRLIHGKNLSYYANLIGWQDAHEIIKNIDSTLREIMSMCTDFLKENNGMMSTLAGTKLRVLI